MSIENMNNENMINENVINENVINENAINAGGNDISEKEALDRKFREQRSVFNKLGFSMLFFSLIAAFAQTLVVAIASIAIPEKILENFGVIIQLMPIYIIAFPALLLIIRWVKKAPEIEQVKKFGAKDFIPFIFISFGAIGLGAIIANLINNLAASAFQMESVNVVATLLSNNQIMQNILMVAIIAPIIEELIFRKLLIDRISRFGEGTAILVSAFAFGIFHGNLAQFIYATALGLVLGYVYAKSKKIILPIILHMTVNFCSGVMMTWVVQLTDMINLENEMATITDRAAQTAFVQEHLGNFLGYYGYLAVYYGFIVAGVVCAIVFLVKNLKKANRKNMLLPGADKLIKGKRFKTVFLNPGVMLFTAFWFFNALVVFFTPLINKLTAELMSQMGAM